MRKFIFAVTVFCLTGFAFADTNGGFAGAFSRLGAGARAQAMGNAYTGLAEGPSAIYFNPGALSFGLRPEFSASGSQMALDRSMQYLAFVAPVHPKAQGQVVNAGVGLAWLHAGVSDIDSRDFDGNALDKISQSSNLFMFSFGVQFQKWLGGGITAKVIYDTYGKITSDNKSVNGDGFGVDAGLFAKPTKHLTLGAQLKDVGSKTTWNTSDYWSQGTTKTDKWPLQYRVGAAYKFDFSNSGEDLESGEATEPYFAVTPAVDVESSSKSDTRIHAGVEGAYELTDRQSVALRAGLDQSNLTAGIGLGFRLWKFKSKVDFTYTFDSVAPKDAQTVAWGMEF